MLTVRDLVTTYGKIEALKGVSLQVREGSITCVLGPNGAGKTTLMMTIAGVLRPSKGTIAFRGEPIAALSPHAIVARGVALVPENRLVFPHMSVLENLHAGAYQRKDPYQNDLDKIFARFPRLKERASQHAGTLSGGEQQMLAVARALMLRPRLLLMDEPSLGLAPLVVEEIFRTIRTINREDGVTILLVEQNAALALDLADHVFLLETGRVVMEGPSDVLRRDDAIRRAYLGY